MFLKINYIRLTITALTFLLQSSFVVGQDIQFSQFYSVPLYQNPAFAGSAFMHRVTLHQRFQWMSLDARYQTSYVAWDNHFEKLRGGIGVSASHDIQGGNKLVSDNVAVQYATEIPLSGNWALRAGAQFELGFRSINYASFQYAQDFTDDGYQGNSYNQYGTERFYYPDISTGLLLYASHLWIGVSSHHMNEPSQTFYNNTNNKLPMKLAFTGGYKYILKTQPRGKLSFTDEVAEYSLTPTFHYKMQGKSDQLDLGFYSQLDMLLVGLWYRGIPIVKNYNNILNNESMVGLLGIKYRNIAFAYSYDFTVSRLYRARTGGSHELNLTFYFEKQNKKKPMKRLPCPDF